MPPGAFLKEVRTIARLKHLSPSTEATYCQIIKRFILFHQKRHPATMGAAEVRAYLAHLAIDQQVAASTQNVALSALLFLYREVLHHDLAPLGDIPRAQRPRCLVLLHLSGHPQHTRPYQGHYRERSSAGAGEIASATGDQAAAKRKQRGTVAVRGEQPVRRLWIRA